MVKYFGKFLIQKSFKRIFNGPKCLMKVIHGNSGLLLSNSTKEKKHRGKERYGIDNVANPKMLPTSHCHQSDHSQEHKPHWEINASTYCLACPSKALTRI